MKWKYQLIMVGLLHMCHDTDAITISRDKPATMSSVYPGSSPQAAVDGYIDTSNTSACSLTSTTDVMPWWMVDLQGTYLIDTVRITTLMNHSYPLQRFFIEIFSENPELCPDAIPGVCVQYDAGPVGFGDTWNFLCTTPLVGRFLRIRESKHLKSNVLPLCQIEVRGTPHTGCSRPKRFPHVKETRLITEQTELLNNTVLRECSIICDVKSTCLAFNVNGYTRQCELIHNPSLNYSKQSDYRWDYYGSDFC